jgi:undecaprenyl phosphate-alpha-L-ara4N flippase subunit ArnF
VTRRALLFAAASVGLVTIAQLGMRWSMMRLPRPEALLAGGGEQFTLLPLAVLAVLAVSVSSYATSLACWLVALRHLAVGRAYSILSLSYAAVYLASALLPGFDGSLSLRKSIGVVLVFAGVTLINVRRSSR